MSLRIAIVGGGLGGLAAALFLRRAGLDAQVYEQSSALREVGAGIVVAPNMVRLLTRLSLTEKMQEFAVQLEAGWEFRRWEDGRVLFVQPLGERCVNLYGTHCYVAHRADLMSMFVEALPREQIFLDHRCVEVKQGDKDVELLFRHKAGEESRVTADVVIGADGIHSKIRELIEPDIEPEFSGLCAFRCLVPAEKAPAMAHRPVQTLWLGPAHHFVHYPISGGQLINIVAFAPAGDWRDESWLAEGTIEDMLHEFRDWDQRLHELIVSASDTKRWALYDRAPLDKWTEGRITLLGDAAHAMFPFFAQGAAQAVEDAAVLALCLRNASPDSVTEALQLYEEIRKPRTTEVQLASRGREVRNHLPDGPAQQQRDLEFTRGDPLQQSAWLYGYDPDVAVREMMADQAGSAGNNPRYS